MAGYKLVFRGLKAFNKKLEDFEVEFPKQHLAIQKKLAFDLFDRIITKNPVGNPSEWKNPKAAPEGYVGGRSRGNWQISIGTPGNTSKVDFEKGVATGTPASAAMEAEAFGNMAQAKFGQTIWIFNNVRYIKRLEDGHSRKQAPAGMVMVSIAEIQAGLAD